MKKRLIAIITNINILYLTSFNFFIKNILWLREYKKSFSTYAIAITSIMLLSVFIYLRFLRNRLPREIPFNLTEFGFYTLIFICFGYLYIIFRLLKPKTPHQIIIKALRYITSPLITLDQSIKNNPTIKLYYNKLTDYVVQEISSYNTMEIGMLIYFCKVIPSFILLLIFLVDVFLLNKLEVFYYFILLNIIPLMYNYYKYSLIVLKEQYLSSLEERYESVLVIDNNSEFIAWEDRNPEAVYHDKTVSLKEYFNIQLENSYMKNSQMDYYGVAFSKEKFHDDYERSSNKAYTEFTEEDYESLRAYFYELEPKVLDLMKYIDFDKYTNNQPYIKKMKTITYGLYFIAWLYILVKSFNTLQYMSLTIKVLQVLTEYSEKVTFLS